MSDNISETQSLLPTNLSSSNLTSSRKNKSSSIYIIFFSFIFLSLLSFFFYIQTTHVCSNDGMEEDLQSLIHKLKMKIIQHESKLFKLEIELEKYLNSLQKQYYDFNLSLLENKDPDQLSDFIDDALLKLQEKYN